MKQWALALGGCLWVLIAWVPALVRLAHAGGVAHVILPTPPSTSGGYGGDRTSTGLIIPHPHNLSLSLYIQPIPTITYRHAIIYKR